jgi:RNA polymerase sigma-70 factor (ECF subfamily)
MRLRHRPDAGAEHDGARRLDPFEAEALSFVDALYGMALRLTRRPSDAEDLVQDTYLKAFRAADRFERGTNLKAWLFTILHNTWRNDRRDAGRDPVEIDSETVEQAQTPANLQATPEQLLLRETLDADLQDALDDLPDVFRQAVWLRDVEEFSYAEIAEMLGVPVGTVMSRIARGRRALYQRLTATSPTRAVQLAGKGRPE